MLPLRALVLTAFVAFTAASGPATARDDAVLAPVLEVQVLDREIVAIDTEGRGQRTVRTLRGERVLYTRSEGRVGVAVTDQRVLAIGASSSSWQQARLRRGESPPTEVRIGGRVALAFTGQRALGFDGRSGNLVESTIGPREIVLDDAAGQNVAVVVTDRRALGLSADRGGFFEVRLQAGELVESLSAFANHASLQTSSRLLVFRAETAVWTERRRTIR
jgi:hypothetical protein